MLLFAAGTDAEWYEEELRAQGLPTYRATGRRYFGQQQVVDLLMYLRLLRNRYDDEALVTVLASPFVGVSNDALVLIRRHAGRRPLFTGIERVAARGALGAEDERLVLRLQAALRRGWSRPPARVSLERLCELVVSEHDYDLAVLARWDGQRRYANLRKLMRLARSYEEVRGRDIEGFVGFLRDQEAFGASQLEAVSEEEGADAVRLLTIHAAKGLEFKVVVVADAGRDLAGPPPADEILALSDGRFGFKVVHPTSGERRAVFGYEEVLGGRARGRPGRAPAPLLRRDDARDRPAARLGRGRRGARDADRLGALEARLRRRARRGRSRRSSSSAAAPRSSCASTAATARAPRRPEEPEPRAEAASCSLFDDLPARADRARLAAARRSRRCRAPPLHRVTPALLLGARALRALLVPLLRRAGRRAARARRRPTAGGRRARGDRDRRRGAPPARARRSRATPRLPDLAVVAAGTRP